MTTPDNTRTRIDLGAADLKHDLAYVESRMASRVQEAQCFVTGFVFIVGSIIMGYVATGAFGTVVVAVMVVGAVMEFYLAYRAHRELMNAYSRQDTDRASIHGAVRDTAETEATR